MEEMIGSYGPRAEPYEKTFASSEAPSGMMARGNYSVRSRVVDDDDNVFADWEWAFKVSNHMMRPCPHHKLCHGSTQGRYCQMADLDSFSLLCIFFRSQIAKDW